VEQGCAEGDGWRKGDVTALFLPMGSMEGQQEDIKRLASLQV